MRVTVSATARRSSISARREGLLQGPGCQVLADDLLHHHLADLWRVHEQRCWALHSYGFMDTYAHITFGPQAVVDELRTRYSFARRRQELLF